MISWLFLLITINVRCFEREKRELMMNYSWLPLIQVKKRIEREELKKKKKHLWKINAWQRQAKERRTEIEHIYDTKREEEQLWTNTRHRRAQRDSTKKLSATQTTDVPHWPNWFARFFCWSWLRKGRESWSEDKKHLSNRYWTHKIRIHSIMNKRRGEEEEGKKSLAL